MKYIVIGNVGSALDSTLYERIETSKSNVEVPLAPRYKKAATGRTASILKLAKALNVAEGESHQEVKTPALAEQREVTARFLGFDGYECLHHDAPGRFATDEVIRLREKLEGHS